MKNKKAAVSVAEHTTALPRQYRQGDVFLVSLKGVLPDGHCPDGHQARAAESGRLILARGEATGHHHSVVADKTTALWAGPNAELFLMVKEGGALLEHQEHAPIALPPGTYQVRIQREYSPEAIRNVQD